MGEPRPERYGEKVKNGTCQGLALQHELARPLLRAAEKLGHLVVPHVLHRKGANQNVSMHARTRTRTRIRAHTHRIRTRTRTRTRTREPVQLQMAFRFCGFWR